MPTLDQVEKITKIGSLAAIPLVIAIMGQVVSVSMQKAEIRAQFIELAIGVLQESPPTDKDDQILQDPLRDWAIGILSDEIEGGFGAETKMILQARALPSFVNKLSTELPQPLPDTILETRIPTETTTLTNEVLRDLQGRPVRREFIRPIPREP